MRTRARRINFVLLGILLTALINGLIFVFLEPPWQHYDEPGHFEYAWLVANRLKLPGPDEYDLNMRQQLEQSMAEHAFYKIAGPRPDASDTTKPAPIGYSQLKDPPLYYVIAAVPLVLLKDVSIEIQLYAARLVSVLFLLATVAVGYAITVELTLPGNPLRWMLPLALALLPSFVDIMTAVSNDPAGILFFSLFLFGAVRLIQRGISWPDLLFTSTTVVLCVFTSRTDYYAIPGFFLTLLFAVFHKKYRWVPWAVLSAGAIILVLAFFTWSDPYLWTRSAAQLEPARIESDQARFGKYVFQLNLVPGVKPGQLFQSIPVHFVDRMLGKPVTIGAWIWASRPVQVNFPVLTSLSADKVGNALIQVNTSPQFYSQTGVLNTANGTVWLKLQTIIKPSQEPVTVYFDGVVLAEGEYPKDQEPAFNDFGESIGTWGGSPFINFVRNGSGEIAGPNIRPWLDSLGSILFPEYGLSRPSFTLYTLLDWQSIGWYYISVISILFRTFWANFGWGNIFLLGEKPYRLLAVVTFAGMLGIIPLLIRSRRKVPWDTLVFLSVISLIVWGMALIRFSNYLILSRPVYPAARYGYPVVIPTLAVICLGWAEIAHWFGCLVPAWRRMLQWGGPAIYISSFIFLNLFSYLSILRKFF